MIFYCCYTQFLCFYICVYVCVCVCVCVCNNYHIYDDYNNYKHDNNDNIMVKIINRYVIKWANSTLLGYT